MIFYTEIYDNIPGKGYSEEYQPCEYEGCLCNESDCISSCSCLSQPPDSSQPSYTKSGLLLSILKTAAYLYPITECNLNCCCSEETCSNRLVQHGPKFKFERFETPHKGGFGLRTKEFITAGSFVISYLGEVIGSNTAEEVITERLLKKEPNYVMFLREYYTKDNSIRSTIIDARNYGCEARFINHSCEPNLCVVPVRVDSSIPYAGLFAIRDIEVMEELTYDYNGSVDKDLKGSTVCEFGPDEVSQFRCYCGSIMCMGFLPVNKY